jgi:hypothetical protein
LQDGKNLRHDSRADCDASEHNRDEFDANDCRPDAQLKTLARLTICVLSPAGKSSAISGGPDNARMPGRFDVIRTFKGTDAPYHKICEPIPEPEHQPVLL